MSFVTRFAPSPTGYLHLGHAAIALRAFDAAREAGGACLLRIEDIDTGRSREEFEAAIYEDLSWLGCQWPQPVRRQSDHFDEYARALERLIEIGIVYRCFKTRREVAEASASAPHAPEPVYVGDPDALSQDEIEARLARGEAFAWRFSTRRCADILGADAERLSFEEQGDSRFGHGEMRARHDALGDAVLARKDVPTSYHLAVTHDDAAQGVTHVIRGSDLFATTSLHVTLQKLLGWPTPIYAHAPLLLAPDGRRLSKRDGAAAVRALRASGATPREIRDIVSRHARER